MTPRHAALALSLVLSLPAAPALAQQRQPASAAPSFARSFSFALDAGVALWNLDDPQHDDDDYREVDLWVPVAQANAHLAWTVYEEPLAQLRVGLGYALRADFDSTGLVLRHELALEVRRGVYFGVVGLGIGTLVPFQDPRVAAVAISLDASANLHVAGPFYVGATTGLDGWLGSGDVFARTGVVVGLATR